MSSTCTTPVPGELITKSWLLTVVSRIDPTILTSGNSNLSSYNFAFTVPSILKLIKLGFPETSTSDIAIAVCVPTLPAPIVEILTVPNAVVIASSTYFLFVKSSSSVTLTS